MLIRRATIEDIDWILGQLKEFSRFYGTKASLFPTEEFARTGMTEMITKHLVIMAEHRTNGLVGFIAGIIGPHMFNPSIRILSETFWWVDERYRGSSAGLKLLNAFTNWGEENCDWISFTLEEKSPVKEECLFRRGFRPYERSYLKEVG